MAKKLIRARFWPIWHKLGPKNIFMSLLLLDVRRCRNLLVYVISRKTFDPD